MLWVLVAVALGAVLAVSVELRLGCAHAQSVDFLETTFQNDTCLPVGGVYVCVRLRVCVCVRVYTVLLLFRLWF